MAFKNRLFSLKAAREYHKQYYLQAIILEYIFTEKEVPRAGMAIALSTQVDKKHEYLWGIDNIRISEQVAYLIQAKHITYNQNNMLVLTDTGTNIVENCIMQNLSASTYIGYCAVTTGWIAICISLIAAVIGLVTLVVSWA